MTQSLEIVSRAFDNARKELLAQRAEINRRLDELERAHAAANKALNGHQPRRRTRAPTVSDDMYEQVRRFVQRNPDCQQKDAVQSLSINSGLVSTAMRMAVERGEIEVDRPGRGARYRATSGGIRTSERKDLYG